MQKAPKRMLGGVRANPVQFERIIKRLAKQGKSPQQARSIAVGYVLEADSERKRDQNRVRRLDQGDRVVKDEANWTPTEFDHWGAGRGVGVVVAVERAIVEVRWPAGLSCHRPDELKKVSGQV